MEDQIFWEEPEDKRIPLEPDDFENSICGVCGGELVYIGDGYTPQEYAIFKCTSCGRKVEWHF
jgi:hypothetical protein